MEEMWTFCGRFRINTLLFFSLKPAVTSNVLCSITFLYTASHSAPFVSSLPST